MPNKSFLVILDGWGLGQDPKRSAIHQAETPYFDELMRTQPNSTLVTYGMQVGLPEGQMGNSEVGHLNIGAGRIVYQELARINQSLRDGAFENNATFQQMMEEAKKEDRRIHLLGLLSDGGVHAHIDHIKDIVSLLNKNGIQGYIHAFLDGRDTDPNSGRGFVRELLEHLGPRSFKLASIVGRYYAMDRDKRWERIKKAYDMLIKGAGEKTTNPTHHIEKKYAEGITDEFMEPTVVVDEQGEPTATIKEGDIVFFVNFRTDRPRQLTEVLTQKDHPQLEMKTLPLSFYTMTSYDDTFKKVKVLFTKEKITNTLGEYLSNQGRSQVRIAETEKYPHVTFFFNGGREEPFDAEKRLLIASPKVATYDKQPEMSAFEITETIVEEMKKASPDFVCLNFANADMVGHTGDFEAAKVAAATVDKCLKQIVEQGRKQGYRFVIIADHGNSDYMINDDGSPHTAHTMNPVPIIVLADENLEVSDGNLADVAPTLLHLMDMDIPEEMTGRNLIEKT